MATRKKLESYLDPEETTEFGEKTRVHCPVVMPRNPKLIRGKIEDEKVQRVERILKFKKKSI